MEEVQNFLVGLKRICLAIGDGVLLAESLDDRLCFSQFVPEHRWEQMMLDLVIQPTIPEVDQGRSRDSGRLSRPSQPLSTTLAPTDIDALFLRLMRIECYRWVPTFTDSSKVGAPHSYAAAAQPIIWVIIPRTSVLLYATVKR